MPISKDEFKKLVLMGPTLEEIVLDFLEKQPGSAYTPMQIASEHFPEQLIQNPHFDQLIGVMLESLRARKKVEGRWRQISLGQPEYYYAVP